ncbi:MAG TPA: FAD-binding oxidoreductase [Acidimicrobiales bacterium]|nr:FAD-binding oxidoreductase [Acidimicrobiales bacterium]
MEADLTPASGEAYRRLSLWWDGLPGPLRIRPALDGDIEVDVAVVGGGLTGLWTAYYLSEADPGLSIAVLERDVAGFGASGRNGGWCSALFSVSEATLDHRCGPGSGRSQRLAMQATVREVGRVVADEGIDCGFHQGGTVVLARTPAQLARTHHEITEARSRGVGEDDLAFLGPEEARDRIGATGVLGGTYTPHCAAVDPARLVRGLADVVERRGVRLFEQTAATSLDPGVVTTERGTVRARTVVRATEGYTRTLAGRGRDVVPVYSLMIATEPLPASFWSGHGLAGRETFADHRHLVIYGQRTEDDRLAFGGRGAPYHFGSAIRPGYDRDDGVHEALRRTLVELFPELSGTAVTHRWGGPLGITRDWFSSVGMDPATRMAWAGGYVGDGLSTTNLAGRTLRDLIVGDATGLTALPWVNHRSRTWELEPFRYLGINAGLRLAGAADRAEERAGRETWHARLLGRLVGG